MKSFDFSRVCISILTLGLCRYKPVLSSIENRLMQIRQEAPDIINADI